MGIGRSVVPRHLVRLAPETGSELRAVDLPGGDAFGWWPLNRLALGRGVVWAIGADNHLLAIDAAGSGAPTVVPRIEATGSVAADGDAAWVITAGRRTLELARVSADARVTARVPVAATDLDGVATGAGALWVTAPQAGLLWRVTPDETRSIDVGAGARVVAVAGGRVWVANAARGTVTEVDPRSNRVAGVIRIGNAPRALAADGERLWVTLAAGSGAPARDAARAASGAVTAPACGAVITGGGTPERLIVSDLPLQRPGIGLIPEAIAFVLRQREFRAGPFRIGYQSCDDSTVKQGDFEPSKCRANAGLYARTPRVVGIIGASNSDCTSEQLPETNRAGPLATISPFNTLSVLTQPVPGGEPGTLAKLYPTGDRHYVRIVGADDGQGAALAQFAHDRGLGRLAIVRDQFDYGRSIAAHARRTARRLGTPVAGPYPIDVEGGEARARALARRIAEARRGAVIYAGVPFWGPLQGEPPGFVLVRALRRRLGDGLQILGPDSWGDGPGVLDALGHARNIHFTYPGVPLERLPPNGRRFRAQFAETQPGGFVTADAVYAAQATEILLEAIARSDGTRASVTRSLLATRVDDGLIGPVRFDANGDVRPRAYSVARITRQTGIVPGVANVDELEAIVSPP